MLLKVFKSHNHCAKFSFPFKNSLLNGKFFSKKNKYDSERTEIKKRDDEIDVLVYPESHPFYTVGIMGHLPIYNYTADMNKYKSFIPAPKLNLNIFILNTYFSYGTCAFQPSLLLTLYLYYRILLNQYRKDLEIIYMGLLNDGSTIIINTFDQEFKLKISETKILEQQVKNGVDYYYEITNKKLGQSLYANTRGDKINKEFFENLLTGDINKVNILFVK